MAEDTAADFCPYVGLQPFTVRDRAYFFGREREQRIIAANLFAAPLTILYGPSAVGKSSVLQAGVVPRLAAEPHTAVLYFATWQGESYLGRLKNECRAAIQSAHGKPIDVDDTLPLDEWIASARLQFRGTLLMMFDQFEEYLLYHGEADESAFDGELARIINRPEVRANILIGLRDDSLSKLNRFSKRIPNLMGNTLPLRRLTPEAARQAIVGPIDQFNRQFPSDRPARVDEALVVRILDEVRTEKMAPSLSGGVAGVHAAEERGLVETAYLQLVLTELWRAASARTGPRVLDSATLDALGGAKAIVRRHVSVELGRLSKEGREIAVRLFQHLVTPSGAKYALRTEDLVALAGFPRERVTPVLTALTAARLLRRIDPPERYEIFHDAFAVAMLEWRQEYVQHRRQRTMVLSAVGAAIVMLAVVGTVVYFFHERRDKADLQRQLELAIGTAQNAAEATTKATESAQQAILGAQQSEEARRLEMELQLQAPRLDAPAKAALEQRATTARATSARASVRSKELDSQSKAAVQATEKGLADLTQIARDKGIAVPAIANSPLTGPVNEKTEAAPAAPVAPPGTAPATPADTKPIAGNYKDTYKKAIEAKNQKRWQQAEELFETALKQNGSESTERINISGFGNVEPYVPKYYLGVVFKNLNNCPAALKQWEDSERDNAIQKTNLYKSLLENRDACVRKQ
ncbi:MAG TPA: hypothetical protein VGJ29_14910, partial [Vicinamibacterales bacterium]